MDKPRKPSLALLALLSALATLFLAEFKPLQKLQAQPAPQPVPTFTPPSSVAEGTTIEIDGTPAMAIINQSLAVGFEEQYPGTDVIVSANGDEAALRALAVGSIDLAAIGRPLTTAEQTQNLTEVPISREKIAIIVGRDNPFQGDLTFEEFARIFWGDITNWSQVGGPDLPLRFIDRPNDSDTRIALSDYQVFQARPFETGDTAIQVEADDTAAIVRELGNNGVSYAIAAEIIGQDAVRPVSMHNTLPNDPRYPYSQPRGYVYQGEPSIPVEAFLGYATNPEGQQDVADAKETEKANVTAGAGQLPEAVALSPDGQFMVRGTQEGALEWLDAQGNVTNTVVPDAHTGMVTDVVISPDGQTVISSGADGLIRRWDRKGTSIGEPIQGTGGPVLALALSPDGQTIVSGNANGTVDRWSVADGSALGEPIAAHDGAVQTVSYPPGGQNFVTGSSDSTIAMWNPDGTLATKVPGAHKGGITDITSSPDGQVLITAGGDGTIRQWDRATLQPRGEALAAHNSAVSAVAVSPNGSTIATAGRDATLQLWEPTGTPLLPNAIALGAPASSLEYTPEGNLIAGTTDGEVDLRDSAGNALDSPGLGDGGLAELYPDLVQRIQNLPRETWWILAAIPLLLILAGILGALLGIKKDDDEDKDRDLEADLPPGLSIDFSGIGDTSTNNGHGESGLITQDLPPEANLVPMEGDPIGGTPGSKLQQAKTDLAEGKRLMREGRYDSALIYFNSAIEATEVERYKAQSTGGLLGGINAIAAQAQAQRGNALVFLGQASDALDSYNAALEIDSSCLEAWIGKGRLLTSLGRFEEAIFCFDTALEMDESSGAAWAGKGQALMQMGRQAEAQDCLDRATALGYGIEPNLPQAGGDADGLGSTEATTGSISSTPDPSGTYPPGITPGPAYDPDIPLELQQAVAALPSEDMILPENPSGYDDVPPHILAAIADLPSATEPAGSIQSGPVRPTPGPVIDAPPTFVEPGPDGDRVEALIEEASLPPASDLDEMLAALDLPYDMVDPAPTPRPTPGPMPSPVSPAEIGAPEVPLEPGDFVPPPDQAVSPPAGNPWEGLPPEVIAAMASIPPDSPNTFGPLPDGTTGGPQRPIAPPVVPIEPGDFIPPPTDGSQASAPGIGAGADLPPEVLAAMASIPADSPDSFGVITPNNPEPPEATRDPSLTAATGNSWIKLSMEQGGSRFHTVWNIAPQDHRAMQSQVSQSFAVRLYDVTGKVSTAPLGEPMQQVTCDDSAGQNCYLSIPQLNRIYLTELGFVDADHRWHAVARSNALAAIS